MFSKILFSIIIAFILFGSGIFVGTKLLHKNLNLGLTTDQPQNNSFQAGWDAARDRIAQSPLYKAFMSNDEIKSVTGIIQKIDGDKITVKIQPLDPLADPDLDVRIITVDADTKIFLAVQKDQAQLEKETKDWQDKMMQTQKPVDDSRIPIPIMPPNPFNLKDIKLSDLQSNQAIEVIADEKIKDKKEFTAIQIEAQEIAVASSSSSELSHPVLP